MSSHLNQSLARVAHAGKELSEQSVGSDEEDLSKAIKFDNLVHETKEVLRHAAHTLNVDEDAFRYFELSVDSMDEDDELKEIIEKLKEHTSEPDTTNEDEASMFRFYQTSAQ